MENKYQKALDGITLWLQEMEQKMTVGYMSHLLNYCEFEDYSKLIDTLQKLIDKYNEMLGDYVAYQDLKVEYEKEIDICNKALESACEDLEKYKKALDIACEILEGRCRTLTGRNKTEWKEYLLKEAETKDLFVEMGIDNRPIFEQLEEAFKK